MVASELSLLGVALLGLLAYGGGDFIGGRASLRLSPVGVIGLAQIAAFAVTWQTIPWSGRPLLAGPTDALRDALPGWSVLEAGIPGAGTLVAGTLGGFVFGVGMTKPGAGALGIVALAG